MLYSPTTIEQAELDILQAPYLGGEFALFMTRQPCLSLGDLVLSAADTGEYTANPAVSLPVGGTHVQVMCQSPLLSDVACEITFGATANDDSAISGVATFEPPAWVSNQSFDFERGYAVDLIPSVSGKTFKALTLESVVGGSKGSAFSLWKLPVLADYSFIGCLTGVNWSDRSAKAVGIDCQMESDAFIKRGKPEKGDLTIKHKLKGWSEGLARFGGSKGTVMLRGVKDGQVTGDVVVFSQFVGATKFDLPEGEGEAMAEAAGKYAECLFFVAPYSPGASAGGGGEGGPLLMPGGEEFLLPGGETLVLP